MIKIFLSIFLLSSVLISSDKNTQVSDKTKKANKKIKKDGIVTHTEFGYIQTDGNTKTQTFNLDSKAKRTWNKDGQYSSDGNIETKNKYLTELEYDYKHTKRLSFGYLVGYKSDKFSGFEYQFYTGPGIKYKAVMTKKHNLSIEGNTLYALDRYEAVKLDASSNVIAYPNPDNIPIASTIPAYNNDYFTYRIKSVYKWEFAKNFKFSQELSIRGSLKEEDNFFAYSKSTISSKISGIFSAGINYKVDYVNLPADGKQNVDTTFTLNLIMDY
jgi:putative salt-induced outer membrane protein